MHRYSSPEEVRSQFLHNSGIWDMKKMIRKERMITGLVKLYAAAVPLISCRRS